MSRSALLLNSDRVSFGLAGGDGEFRRFGCLSFGSFASLAVSGGRAFPRLLLPELSFPGE